MKLLTRCAKAVATRPSADRGIDAGSLRPRLRHPLWTGARPHRPHPRRREEGARRRRGGAFTAFQKKREMFFLNMIL